MRHHSLQRDSLLRHWHGMAIFCLLLALPLVVSQAVAQELSQAQGAQEESQMNTNELQSPVPGITLRFIDSNGIRLRIAEAGSDNDGPLVLFAHGWPESWYSWRHQLLALAAEGYRVVAPDMRGYGSSDAPLDVEAYKVTEIAADLVGVLDALGEEQAVLVGHDWGAIVSWQTVLLHPQRFRALVAMSVPYGGRPPRSPMDDWRAAFGENFYYILYHNEPGGLAEAEYDADPYGLLSRLYLSPDSPREPKLINDPKASAGGWIGRLGAAKGLPAWLRQQDLDYVVGEFQRAGFRGGVNYYRNFQRNWELTKGVGSDTITMPTLFIAGSEDMVIAHASAERLGGAMSKIASDFRGVKLFPGIGHWVQQEAPEATNAALIEFLGQLDN